MAVRLLRFLPFLRRSTPRTGILPMDRDEERFLERKRAERQTTDNQESK